MLNYRPFFTANRTIPPEDGLALPSLYTKNVLEKNIGGVFKIIIIYVSN